MLSLTNNPKCMPDRWSHRLTCSFFFFSTLNIFYLPEIVLCFCHWADKLGAGQSSASGTELNVRQGQRAWCDLLSAPTFSWLQIHSARRAEGGAEWLVKYPCFQLSPSQSQCTKHVDIANTSVKTKHPGKLGKLIPNKCICTHMWLSLS